RYIIRVEFRRSRAFGLECHRPAYRRPSKKGRQIMNRNSRRQFLADVGRGMLVASVGSTLAGEIGFGSTIIAEDAPSKRLTFGALEPLVALMEETPADRLLPLVVTKLRTGTQLRTLVSAAALANARAFGGHDYDGYHTFMALAPSYHMAQ